MKLSAAADIKHQHELFNGHLPFLGQKGSKFLVMGVLGSRNFGHGAWNCGHGPVETRVENVLVRSSELPIHSTCPRTSAEPPQLPGRFGGEGLPPISP